MDPATIAAGAQVIGGLLGRNKSVKPGDTTRHTVAGIYGQAQGAREAGERYGFNPMALLGVSSPIMPQGVDNSYMGQAIANAGLALADGMTAQQQQQEYATKLEEQNKVLRTALDASTIRPRQAGIFGTVQAPTIPIMPGEQPVATDSAGNPVPHLEPTVGPFDDRETVVNPIQNEPWFKKGTMLGEDVTVWNDEFSESEVMSTLFSISTPFQVYGQKMIKAGTSLKESADYYGMGHGPMDLAVAPFWSQIAAAKKSGYVKPYVHPDSPKMPKEYSRGGY